MLKEKTKTTTNPVGAGLVPARNKNYNGITLIALVITIIVMLILVGVTISVALNGGLFETAQKVAENTETQRNKELELSDGRVEIENVWYDSADDYLANNPSDNQEEKIYNITVNATGCIAKEGNPTTIKENETVTLYYVFDGVDSIASFSASGAEVTEQVLNYEIEIKVSNPTTDVIINIYCEDCCFVAGTQVWLADGTTKNIEDVLIGDIVMSYNEITKEYEPAKVTNRIINPNTINLARLNFKDGSSIEMNEYHPIYTKEGWKSLTNYNGLPTLTKDDEVLSYNNNFVEIKSIDTWTVEKTITSYNLSVEKNHNYFVGEFPVLVHNAACPN